MRHLLKFLWFSALTLLPLMAQTAPPAFSVDGIVRDATGAAVQNATVRLQSGPLIATSRTDAAGHFAFNHIAADSGTVEVTADGFVAVARPWTAEPPQGRTASTHLEIVLQPASTREQVMVSAARTEVRLAETPGSSVLLSETDLTASPALRIDDVLREVPGFSLFRRSSSRSANASSQGVSLRGLGGTAASRALILADGISLVDPFGGWVYWDRIPRTAISSVEVVRGGASNLYGSNAMGGVVQVFVREPEAPAFSLETSGGNENTPELSLWAGSRSGKWDYSAATEMYRSDGFILVPVSQGGSVDTPANAEDATVIARLGRQFGTNGKIFARGNFLTEFRHNGTVIQTNDTQIGEGAGGLDKQFGKDMLSVRLYGSAEAYYQKNSSVTSVNHQRDTETLTSIQHVPEQVAGGGAQWTHFLGSSQTLIGGMDLSEVIGASNDSLFSGPNKNRFGGGRQRTLGWFGEDVFRHGPWTVMLAARVDDWNNFNGHLITIATDGTPTVTLYPSRSELAFSPRLSILRQLSQYVSLTVSGYRAFRAPTLNELYRTFRVGSVTTLNNPDLKAEHLTGAEAGINITGWNRKLDLRATGFSSDIVNPVENVTISQTQRQKENLGRVRSRGVELDAVLRPVRDFQITAGYAYTAASVVSYPVPPGGIDLTGLDVPQVPRNVFTWEARYWNPSRLFASVQGRFVSRAFDDDQNQFQLGRFYTMSFQVGRELTRNVEIFAAAENFTNQRYQVAKTPVSDPNGLSPLVNLGPPILVRVGLRLNFPSVRK